jgi:hypothetical protein
MNISLNSTSDFPSKAEISTIESPKELMPVSHMRELSFSPKFKDLFSIQKVPTPKELKCHLFDRSSSPTKRSSSTAKQVYTKKTQVIKKNSSLERRPNFSKLDISFNSHKRLESIYTNITPIITNRTLSTRSRSLARGVELKKNVKLTPIKKSPTHERLQIIQTRRIEAFVPTQIVLNIRSPKKIKIIH